MKLTNEYDRLLYGFTFLWKVAANILLKSTVILS